MPAAHLDSWSIRPLLPGRSRRQQASLVDRSRAGTLLVEPNRRRGVLGSIGKKTMASDRYIHPEFGCLVPTSRFRRELRVAFFSIMFGIAIGAATVIALTASTPHANLTSVLPVDTFTAVAAPPATAQAAPEGDPYKACLHTDGASTAKEIDKKNAGKPNAAIAETSNLASNKRSLASKPRNAQRSANTPPIARLPLGRSTAHAGSISPGDQTGAGGSRGATTLEDTTARTSKNNENAADRRTPLPRKRPEKADRRKNPPPNGSREERGNRWSGRDRENRAANVVRAYTLDNSPSPRGFWAWSW